LKEEDRVEKVERGLLEGLDRAPNVLEAAEALLQHVLHRARNTFSEEDALEVLLMRP
jgi:hypothetical protein